MTLIPWAMGVGFQCVSCPPLGLAVTEHRYATIRPDPARSTRQVATEGHTGPGRGAGLFVLTGGGGPGGALICSCIGFL
jgi:hypothetical protein